MQKCVVCPVVCIQGFTQMCLAAGRCVQVCAYRRHACEYEQASSLANLLYVRYSSHVNIW
jgi:hypothetical protein